MRCALVLIPVVTLLGCRAVERATLQPLPEVTTPLPFADLVARARLQAMSANEAFYIDQWGEVDAAARGIEQSARFLKQATAVPPTRTGDYVARADALAREASRLGEAARARDANGVSAALQRIHTLVRELR
jgi:hypothetical protein